MSRAENPDPWELPEAQWRAIVDEVGAGNGLDHRDWPGNAAVAVAISVDVDNETLPLSQRVSGPGPLSHAQYGARVGIRRVVDALNRHSVPATFFYPAVSAMLAPERFAEVRAAGHEIGLHGWIHERCGELTPAQELELGTRSIEALTAVTGTRPVGMRTPYWDFTVHTLPIAQQLGLEYDSSLMADDQPYELLRGGEPTGLTEVPVSWIRDDAPYFPDDALGKQALAPHDVLRIWQDEFDGAYAEGGLFTLALHPHVIGHRSRIKVLHDLLAHIAAHSGVWCATHAEIARYATTRRTRPAQ
ncbi:polysaccharide deacetylase [Amycolatopsis sp. Hca4]|uniref:polysaccharide deacetylase family protein n=1 Tax=Amycolatopsis sp. Hca4 TaxID=2742131 RepID=UPI0015919A52|nr:polysaccharide deacetylase [Amycolatopsis sp. Hca4]QKV74072.1 polysaccharide deacetylase [Amycolatopsis sp. Hca4]